MYNKSEIIKSKIITSKEELSQDIARWRLKEQKIVFTNGCFDILHLGHVDYLNKAAGFGDVLIIGLNTDESVKRLKGSDRPLNNQHARAMVLASLYVTTKVVCFDEDTPYELIKFVQPDVLVKGADYKEEDIVGADIVKARGGEIRTIEFVDGYSTTKMIEKIKNE